MELDKKRTGIEEKLYDLSLSIVNESELELYDAEYLTGSSTLRVFVMDPKTKTAVIEDCVKVDRGFSPYCDEEDEKFLQWIPGDFVLEVSSPGMYRNLKSRKHFELHQGDIVSCVIFGRMTDEQSSDLSKRLKNESKFRAELVSLEGESLTLRDLEEEVEFNLNIEQIKKINLDPDLNN